MQIGSRDYLNMLCALAENKILFNRLQDTLRNIQAKDPAARDKKTAQEMIAAHDMKMLRTMAGSRIGRLFIKVFWRYHILTTRSPILARFKKRRKVT